MLQFLNRLTLTERALLTAFVVSGALLAGAHLFERVGGLAPCALCLDQREAHWAGMGVAAAGLGIGLVLRARLGAAAAVGAASLVYAVSAGLAFYHTGVEFKFWPGPATCLADSDTISSIDTIAKSLGERAPGPACDEVSWRLFGVSMAGYNLLASAGLFALTFVAAIAETRRARSIRRIGSSPDTPEVNT